MGQPKFRPDAAKPGARYRAGVLGDPEPIAKRFAHAADSRHESLRRADSPPGDSPTPMHAAMVSAKGTRTRLLVVALALAALVPNLVLLALWLGMIGVHGSQPVMQEPAPQAATPTAVLTAPARIEAIAGETIGLPIALDGTDGVPPRSVLAIKNLPPGAKFSEGRPYGDNEWTLRPDQIGDLALVVPGDAPGEFKLGIALIAPDDKVIAEAEALLAIAPAQAPMASVALSPDPDDAAAPGTEPEEGDGGAATMEAATAPASEAPPEVEQTQAATVPSVDTQPKALGQADDGENGLGTVEPSVFVNLRERPASSSPVLGVIAKGAKLPVLDRQRGWVQVTDPATAKMGWIYSGLLAGETKTYRRRRRAAPAEPEPKSESFWGRVGDWLSPGG